MLRGVGVGGRCSEVLLFRRHEVRRVRMTRRDATGSGRRVLRGIGVGGRCSEVLLFRRHEVRRVRMARRDATGYGERPPDVERCRRPRAAQ